MSNTDHPSTAHYTANTAGNACIGNVKGDSGANDIQQAAVSSVASSNGTFGKNLDRIDVVVSNRNVGGGGDTGADLENSRESTVVEHANKISKVSTSEAGSNMKRKVGSNDSNDSKLKNAVSTKLSPITSSSGASNRSKSQLNSIARVQEKQPGRKRRGRPPNNSRKQAKSSADDTATTSKIQASTSPMTETTLHVMPLTKKFTTNASSNGSNTDNKKNTAQIKEYRWRAHRAAEDYISLVGDIMYPGTYMAPFGYSYSKGNYPIERPCTLGLLTSPLRRPTVIEKWSPYEIACFEAALTLHGKVFHIVQKVVKTKTTKEIIEFYYIWKKTSHYKRWKQQLEPDVDDYQCEELDWRQPGRK